MYFNPYISTYREFIIHWSLILWAFKFCQSEILSKYYISIKNPHKNVLIIICEVNTYSYYALEVGNQLSQLVISSQQEKGWINQTVQRGLAIWKNRELLTSHHIWQETPGRAIWIINLTCLLHICQRRDIPATVLSSKRNLLYDNVTAQWGRNT